MGFFQKHRGSISIFLSIILLPSLAFSGLMVDIANINLSKALVEGAGELTTNAALANYDTVLKDVYGLFAMSQAAEDPNAALQENLERYFRNSLQASGLIDGEDDLQLQSELLGKLQSLFTDTANVNKNFLNVDIANFTAKYAENSSLANPVILKSQIVEFMKYRGPAEVGLSFLDSLSVFKKVNAQSTVADAKVKVDNKLGDLGEQSAKFYETLCDYEKRVGDYKVAETEFKKNLSDIEAAIKRANEKILMYLISPADFSTLADVTNTSGNSYSGSTTDYESLKLEINAFLEENDAAQKRAKSAVTKRLDKLAGYVSSNDIKSMNTFISDYNSYAVYLKNLLVLKTRFQSASYPAMPESEEEEEEEEVAEIDEDETDEERASREAAEKEAAEAKAAAKAAKVAAYKAQMDADRAGLISRIDTFFDSFERDIADFVRKQAGIYKDILDRAKGEVNVDISYVSNQVISLYTPAKAIKEEQFHVTTFFKQNWGSQTCIEFAILKGEVVIKKLNEVVTANTNLASKNTSYAGDASNGGKDEFYASMNSEYEKNAALFKAGDVDEIINQLKAAQNYLGVALPYIKNLNFYGKTFYNSACDTADEAIKAAKNKADETTVKKAIDDNITINEAYAQSLYNNKHDNSVSINTITDPAKDIYLKKISEVHKEANKVVPPFYIYLVSTYGTSIKKGDDKSEKNLKANASKMNEAAIEEASPKTDIVYPFEVFKESPSKSTGDALKSFDSIDADNKQGATKQFSSMQTVSADIFTNLANIGEGMRDNFLVSEYVFQNFSYATAEKEKTYDPLKYKTLTNVPISKDNNAIYGCEIEYMIFGKQGNSEKNFLWFVTNEAHGPETNISVAKMNIFAIRFVFNSIYALTDGTINSQTYPPALAIQGATGGLFPYQLAQVVLKLALALAESALDLREIMSGGEVALMKSSKTWRCSVTGMLDVAKEEAKEIAAVTIDNVTKNLGKAAIGYIQDGIDNATEWTETKIGELSMDLEYAVNSTLTSSVSAMVQITTDKIQANFINLFTSGIEYNTTVLADDIDSALNQYIDDFCKGAGDNAVREFLIDRKSTIKTSITDKLGDKLQVISNNINDVMGNSDGSIAINGEMFNELQETIAETTQIFMDNMTTVIENETKIFIVGASEELKSVVKDKGGKIVDNVAEKLSSKSTELLNDYFPSKKTTINQMDSDGVGSSAKESIFMFSYKDYLRLFLFLKLSADSNNVMLRIADVIQLNVGKEFKYNNPEIQNLSHSKGTSFRMNEAFTYVEINTDIQVKALLLSNSMFTRGSGDPTKKPINYWTYNYKTIAGY